MASDKSGSPTCGIYIRIYDFSDMQSLITNFRQMAMVVNRASGYEKNMCVVECVKTKDKDDPQTAERITDMIGLVQSQGFIAIISGQGFSDIPGADGVLLSDTDLITKARKDLGEDAIIGLKCGSDRELIQKASMLGADYVDLAADPALINWFSGLGTSMLSNTTPAIGGIITQDNCVALVRAGASLIDVSHYIMKHKKGVMQGTVNILHAIEEASQIPEKLN